MTEYLFNIEPCPAPRMVNSDRWNPSKAASRYFGFRNHLRSLANIQGLDGLPCTLNTLIFHLPLPASWSKRKKDRMRNTPHQQTPDLDNLCKAFLDALCPRDSHIHCIESMKKVWNDTGSIVLIIDNVVE